MFIGPCIIVIVEEWKTLLKPLNNPNLLIPYEHYYIQTLYREGKLIPELNPGETNQRFQTAINPQPPHTTWTEQLCFSLQNEHHPKPAAPNLQHTTNWEQDDRCGNSTTQSQAPENGYINPLGSELFFLILAHSVYKMWIVQEPNKLELWNKLHFEGKKTESIEHV